MYRVNKLDARVVCWLGLDSSTDLKLQASFLFFLLVEHPRVHLTVCTVDFTIFTVVVTVFLTFIFLNFESENTDCRYR